MVGFTLSTKMVLCQHISTLPKLHAGYILTQKGCVLQPLSMHCRSCSETTKEAEEQSDRKSTSTSCASSSFKSFGLEIRSAWSGALWHPRNSFRCHRAESNGGRLVSPPQDSGKVHNSLEKRRTTAHGTTGQRDTGPTGQRDNGTPGQRDNGTPGQRDTGPTGHRANGTPGNGQANRESQRDNGRGAGKLQGKHAWDQQARQPSNKT